MKIFRKHVAAARYTPALAFLSLASLLPGEEAAPPEEKENEAGPRFAFLCLKSDRQTDEKSLRAAVVKSFGLKEAAEVGEIDVSMEDGKYSLSVMIGEHSFVAVRAGNPVPKDDIDYAAGNAFLWDDAAKEMRQQTDHFIAFANGAYATPVEGAFALSRFLAALSLCHDTAGIFWGHASVVHEPADFRKRLAEASTKMEDLPALLWVGFLRDRDEDGGTNFYTDGLDAFGLKEFEVVGSRRKPSEILSVLHGLAQYSMAKGDVIKDGDTVGGTADEKIKARFADSAIGREDKVIRIEY